MIKRKGCAKNQVKRFKNFKVFVLTYIKKYIYNFERTLSTRFEGYDRDGPGSNHGRSLEYCKLVLLTEIRYKSE